MNSTKVFCSTCGTPLTTDQAFCYNCGAANARFVSAKQDEPIVSDAENTEIEKAMPVEGCMSPEVIIADSEIVKAINTETAPITSSPTKICHAQQKQKRVISEIIKKSVILAVSIALLVLAFLPVLSVNFTVEQNSMKFEPSLSISSVDTIVLLFDAAQSLETVDIEDSQLYDDFVNISDDIAADVSGNYKLDKQERAEVSKKLSKIMFLTIRIALCHEEYRINATLIAGAILALVYILATVAFFIIALLDILFYALGKSKKGLEGASATLLTLVPALVISLAAAIEMSFNFDAGAMMRAGSEASGLSAYAIVSLVISLLSILYIIIHRIVISKTGAIKASEIIRRGFVLALAIVMICAAFVPVVSMDVKTVFSGKSKYSRESQSVYPVFFNNFNVSQDEIETYEDLDRHYTAGYMRDTFDAYQYYTVKEFARGECNDTTASLLKDAFMGFGGAQFAPLISLMPIILLAIVLFASVLAWMNLKALATGKAPHGAITIPVKILGILFSVISIAIVIVVMIICNNNLGVIPSSSGSASISIGAGTILAVIGSIAITCIPMGKRKVRTQQ